MLCHFSDGFVLYKIGTKEAILVSLIRVILVSLLFSNVMAMAYSIAGAVLSLSVMWLLKKTDRFSFTFSWIILKKFTYDI